MVGVVRTSGAVGVEGVPVDTAGHLPQLVRPQVTLQASVSEGREPGTLVKSVTVRSGADVLGPAPGSVVEGGDPGEGGRSVSELTLLTLCIQVCQATAPDIQNCNYTTILTTTTGPALA